MSRADGSIRSMPSCQWFMVERPVVGRVFVAHRGRSRVLATKLADPPGGPAMDSTDFVHHLRREFGVLVEADPSPDPSWPFELATEPFQAGDLVDLSRLTNFQRRVMEATARIAPGQLRTYGEVADAIGQQGSAMAVGQAMKSNPAPLVIPCHRVVAKGYLGGWVYGGDLKRRILEHEGVHLPSIGAVAAQKPDVVVASRSAQPSLEERIRRGESHHMEFKSHAGLRKGRILDRQKIVSTVCGFLNAEGGELIIGVEDDGRPRGLALEHRPGKRFDRGC